MFQLTMDRHPEWKEQAIANQISVRLGVLKAILNSKNLTDAAQKAFSSIREEALAMPLPQSAGIELKIEYGVLKCGSLPYRGLVKLYYGFMSDKMRMARNEHLTTQ